MKNIKYIILDFGKVLAYPITGNWDLTPRLLELIEIKKLDIEKLKQKRKQYNYILSEKIETLEQEYDMYIMYYSSILENIDKKIIEEISYDRTYNDNKYKLYSDVLETLKTLKQNYKIILLSDNWPSVIPYMKNNNIYNLFDKIYISSIYGEEKKDKTFFNYPIKEFNIKPHEAIFIDDNEALLDIAKEKGLDVILMDRDKSNKSKYKTINNLEQLEKILKKR